MILSIPIIFAAPLIASCFLCLYTEDLFYGYSYCLGSVGLFGNFNLSQISGEEGIR